MNIVNQNISPLQVNSGYASRDLADLTEKDINNQTIRDDQSKVSESVSVTISDDAKEKLDEEKLKEENRSHHG